ncbi:MAG: hypothetical protein QXP27_09895 [Candidatus Methanomethyliaceae archaeon]
MRRYLRLILSKLYAYPTELRIILGVLVFQACIPVLWFVLMVTNPTPETSYDLPGLSCAFTFCLTLTGTLPLIGIAGILLGKAWGRAFAILSLLWIGVVFLFIGGLEIIHYIVSDYPDPLPFVLFVVAISLVIIIVCTLGVAWLARSMADHK